MGRQFEDEFGYKHITTSEIARGGQGAVFRTQNPNIAVKVELNPTGTEFSKDTSQNKRLDEIRLLPISRKINLTLPQATLKNFAGYAMTLLDDMDSFENVFDYSFDSESGYSNGWLDDFRDSAPEFVDVIGQYLESGGRRRRLDAYLKVACILSALHANGLVYCDFSSRNAFISKIEGNNTVWLIDADNLNYQERTRHAGYYTPGYGAPEVIKGKGCTFYSDSYAFTISLFWQLTGTHPFKGASMESGFDDDFADDVEEKANSGELPWIMDSEDSSNYIDAKIQQDLVISNRLNRYFDRTFSETGKTKRQTRPTMFEWSYMLAKELDLSVKCRYCEMDYDESYATCPWCDTNNKKIVFISSGKEDEVWRFAHEMDGEESISVPGRIIRGFRAEECDTQAFSINKQAESLVIGNLDETYEWSISTDKAISYIDIYGKATIPFECVIKSVHKVTREAVMIEVSQV
jgi:serine/threonine protein kinase